MIKPIDPVMSGGDRPTLEIEITPLMVHAGVAALCDFELPSDWASEAVRAVFEAMMKAAQSPA